MTDTGGAAGFVAMKGSGYYSKATTGAREVIDAATPLVLDAVGRMGVEGGAGVFRAADLGSADGGTSMEMWRRVLGEVRRRAPARPIEMVYTDLPRNDFSQLFRVVHNQTEIRSYYGEITDVFPLASATSFHEAILPPDCLDLGFSATASHYISRVPCPISDHVHMVGASGAERAAYEELGRIEWERFLALRARELVAGGRLCLLNFGIDEQGRYLGHTGGESMFDTFHALWAELADDKVISSAEYLAANFPQVYRTIEQITAPLDDSSSPVRHAGLRLEHVESRFLRCPYARAFAEHGDAERYAREYIPTLRSWSEPTFAHALTPERSAAEQSAILDEFYGRYERRVARSPSGHGMDYVHIHLICTKK